MKKFLTVLLIATSATCFAQNINADKSAFAHTFSIVARDAKTGDMAVAVQSHWFSVGSLVSWGKSGVGVVATQSFVNPAYGPKGLALMQDGKSAKAALEELIAEDEGKAYRQVAFLDVNGNAAAYTGEKCVVYASQITGDNFSVQANMMLTDQTVPAMAEAFEANSDLPLAERMVEVLKAAQNAGGDIRGKQSAALIVVGPEQAENPWEEYKINLRVDDHENPIEELDRLLKVARAYEYMNRGDLAVEAGDMPEALKQYGAAETMFPNNLEMKFWAAVAMANDGQLEEAKPIFKGIFEQDENWREMISRLVKPGLLTVTEDELEEIQSLD
ncbi:MULTISPECIES: DUF1028 domain-containing protein [unclassified Leeuwenhoekiella]|uniref:DUF1028 domain-containing protein n=1 Tax=unclassified Leeuwenhoekiella TaxID=2615029 RepID=UPI000C4CD544|nr:MULTISPECIES: DUF1028 domain-containing protein [unclassified Leeuwenhoekiella]MAW96738.1 Zn-dependent protease [Leeuwenhoekiella sp.]MBA81627.1 Zn-dependent protease [Leeuwenhoekiella sp.]|tara:strand:- start:18372 stop:19361 length:990 start_codon:yes stop_codon:yes gene_type:complete